MVLSPMDHKELATLQGTPAQLGTLWRVLPLVLVFLEDTGVDNSQIAGVRKLGSTLHKYCSSFYDIIKIPHRI